MAEFCMPSLGADLEAGSMVEWLKKRGEAVRRGDIVAVVETEKGAIEIEIFEDGMLERYLVEPGVEVPVGTPLAMIRKPGEPEVVSAQPEEAPSLAASPPRPAPSLPPKPQRFPSADAPSAPGRVRASPAARKLAQEREIDLARVRARRPDGVIELADIEAAVAVAVAKPAAQKTLAGASLDQMRAAIAAAMSRSKREIPHYYLSNTIDIGAAANWVATTNADRTPDRRLLLGALYVKATAVAARVFPEFNGFFEDGAFRQSPAIHVGVAVSIRGGGLAAPAIHETADLRLDDLMAKMRDLVSRVRAGRFRSSEVADPTITVSSLGERGVEALWGVIYPPQVAIVGFGKVVERPWAIGEALAVRPVVQTTLAADHRVSDGHRGALFLARIGELLQRPEAL
jgi:pyruvate dehydrogenase E2 component (dihydrolipoamide acetyltransferase)